MSSTTIEYRLLPGTRAAVGRAGKHTVIADRPEGKSGGLGLGFNGGELLALAIGGCFSNDMQAIAEQMGLVIADLQVTVSIEFDGEPVRAIRSLMSVKCELQDGTDPAALIERAKSATTIGNSLARGIAFSVTVD